MALHPKPWRKRMFGKTLIDDFGNLKLNQKWYANEGSHIIHRTGGEMVRTETTIIDTEFDEELGLWMYTAV